LITVMALVRRIATLFLSCFLASCVDLPDVAPGVCGNGVVEPDADPAEDCDGYAPPGERCRPPSSKEEFPCRYDCAETTDPRTNKKTRPSCPVGMSCGLDGVCRSGTEEYTNWGESIALQAHALSLGDVDGDGRADLLTLVGSPDAIWRSEPKVLFFASDGKKTRLFDPQNQIASPTWFELPALSDDQRPRQSIVAATSMGIAALAADASQEIAAVPYPFQTLPPTWSYRMVRIYGLAGKRQREDVLLYMSDESGGFLLSGDTGVVLGSLAHPAQDLAGEPVAGNLNVSDDSPCDEIVFAFTNDSRVYAHEVCDAKGNLRSSDDAPRVIATLADGATVKTSPILARIDSDDLLDLLVIDNLGSPYVAFGLGNGSFVADPSDAANTVSQLWPVEIESADCVETEPIASSYPLAIGDLNRDGKADWVLPRGIALTQMVSVVSTEKRVVISACAGNEPSGKVWSSATVADLNRDGLLDLVAGSSLFSGLDFFQGSGKDMMTHVGIPSDGPVRHIITGDYDGDGTADIAFVQRLAAESTDPASTTTDSFAIAFGSPMAVPNEPVNVAQFPIVDQLLSANYLSNDNIEAIGVLSSELTPGNSRLSVFFGNHGRHPLAALGLWEMTTNDGPIFNVPLASTVGRFLPSGTQSVLALGIESSESLPLKCRLWFADSDSTGRLGSPTFGALLRSEAVPYRTAVDELAVHFAVGRVDLDDLDDAVLLTAGPDDQQVSIWRVAVPFPDGADALTWLSSAPGTLTAFSSPTLVDLDGDGRSDLVLLLTVDGTQQAKLIWNNAGSFDLALADTIQIPAETVRGLARRSDNDAAGLFVITDGGVYTLTADPARKTTLTDVYYTKDRSDRLPGGEAIAIGDMTGDGLADIVVSGGGRIRIYQQRPRLP
jgi:hypothetical protein